MRRHKRTCSPAIDALPVISAPNEDELVALIMGHPRSAAAATPPQVLVVPGVYTPSHVKVGAAACASGRQVGAALHPSHPVVEGSLHAVAGHQREVEVAGESARGAVGDGGLRVHAHHVGHPRGCKGFRGTARVARTHKHEQQLLLLLLLRLRLLPLPPCHAGGCGGSEAPRHAASSRGEEAVQLVRPQHVRAALAVLKGQGVRMAVPAEV
jgi:hypothetical protein